MDVICKTCGRVRFDGNPPCLVCATPVPDEHRGPCPLSEGSNGECRDPVNCVHWGREGCAQGKAEHRGSRMPDLIRECAADPLFADAVFHEFTPEQAEMVKEKAGGRP